MNRCCLNLHDVLEPVFGERGSQRARAVDSTQVKAAVRGLRLQPFVRRSFGRPQPA